MQIKRKTFEKFGRVWFWYGDGKKVITGELLRRGHWENTKGTLVEVYPRRGKIRVWFIEVHVSSKDIRRYKFYGKDAGERAFAVAELFSRQKP